MYFRYLVLRGIYLMKIILVRPSDPRVNVSILTHSSPLNLGYLAAYLIKYGHKVEIWDYEVEKITDEDVKKAKSQVEEELIFNMLSTLPEQQKLVIYAIAKLSLEKKPMQKITGETEKGVLFSGEIYEEYCRIAKRYKESVVSSRWYRQYINELEMYGLILITASGKGIKGQTRLIKLGYNALKIRGLMEKELEM